MRERTLLRSLVLLLVASTLAALASVGGTVLFIRLPQIMLENRMDARREAEQLAERVELFLSALEEKLQLLGRIIDTLPDRDVDALLDDELTQRKGFEAVYLVSPDALVEAIGVRSNLRHRRAELLGGDLSANRLYQNVRKKGTPAWSDKYLSALSGNVTLGYAVPVGGRVLIGEVSLAHLLHTVRIAQGRQDLLTWVIDSRGEVVADTAFPENVGSVNLLGHPVVQAALKGEQLLDEFNYEGKPYHPAATHSAALDWFFFVHMPAGLHNREVRNTLLLVLLTLAGSLVMGILFSQFWTGHIVAPVQAIIDRARKVAQGGAPQSWPRGSVVEFNQLSENLENMAKAIRERERKLELIFNFSPVPMAVSTPRPDLPDGQIDYVISEVNDAWIQQFRQQRENVLGRNGDEIGIWRSPEERQQMLESLRSGEDHRETWLVRRDGTQLLCEVAARQVEVEGKRLLIITNKDVTDHRHVEQQLRNLNLELEQRVELRTRDLDHTNQELTETLQRLQRAQTELVRTEKLAALGSLVAGIAHELNTPIGNGLMAVTSLQDRLAERRSELQQSLPSDSMNAFFSYLDTGLDISVHNLRKAAELITGFKQVAVDQTSSQRRTFDLHTLVEEILLTLHPTIKRTPFEISVEVPPDMLLDSYPGPLGQVLTNLINNAIVHGLDGRSSGHIQISATAKDESIIQLQVADNGCGIEQSLQHRIFDPFVTSRMGRGSSGIGLHVTHNAVTNILGGSIRFISDPAKGTTFEIELPKQAPKVRRNPIDGGFSES